MPPPPLAVGTATVLALTRNQLNIWLGQQAAPGLPVFNELAVVVIDGHIDRDRFDRALQAVIDGTDALRLTVDDSAHEPRFRVREELVHRSPLVDLSGEPDPDAALEAWARGYADLMLDLSDRLFDSTLVRLSDDRWAWALLQHHLITDATSLTLLVERLGDRYRQLTDADDADADDPEPVDYPQLADYLSRLDELTAAPGYAATEAFWQGRMTGAPPPMVFFDGRSLARDTLHRRERHDVNLGPEMSRRVRDLAGQDGIRLVSEDFSLFSVFAAALFTQLYRTSGEPRRSIGVPWQNRTPDEAGTVGLLMEQDPFTVTVGDGDSFRDVVAKVHREALTVMRHLPYAAGNPGGRLYDVALNVVKVAVGDVAGMPAHTRWYRPTWGEGSVLLHVHDLARTGELTLSFDLNTELFTPTQRASWIAQFCRLLESCAADPGAPISALELLPDEELTRLEAWNETGADYPRGSTTIDLVQAMAADRPHARAATFGDETVSYAELLRRVDRTAAELRALGAGPGTFVGVCLHRSVEMLVTVLGVMRSGAAYVPLDPAFPADRLDFMLEDSGSTVLVTQRALAGAVSGEGCAVLVVEDVADRAADAGEGGLPGPTRATPDDLAYVLYTSGSTGRPKGVEIPHRALTNFLWSMRETPGCGPDDSLLAVTTLSFDIAGLELFLPLISGGHVEIAARADAIDGRRLRERLDRGGITMLQATPATFRILLDAGWTGTPGLTVLVGGEPLPPELVGPLLDGTDELWNMYGPTETTIWSSVDRIVSADDPITVGRPIANTTFHVLDRDGRPTPVGVPGELYIGGDGLARGYHGRPELTAERFVTVATCTAPDARLYRTGDLVRFAEDGRVVHLGRLDNQVKIRGFRIELGEIETVLGEHPAVRQAVVDARTVGAGTPVLVAYYVARDGEQPTAQDLREHLRAALPDYMVPGHVVALDSVPLTPNGKVDRKALPDVDDAQVAVGRSSVPPRTPVERALARIWAQVLHTDRIGVHDDFFEIGGHSLLALQMLTKVVAELGVDVPLDRMIEASTVEALAAVVESMRGPGDDGYVEMLTSVWRDVLGVQDVSPDEDFLALQGDRDLVTELLARTRRAAGVVAEGLSAGDFRRRPTIRAMAETLRHNETPTPALVVPLRATGSKTPLFLVHAGGGYVFFYRALAEELDPDRPVYGVRAESPRDGGGRAFVDAPSLEDVAAHYVEEILAVQPTGPYLVGGACAGGIVAFEMARQLQARGESLAGPVIVFDAFLRNNPYVEGEDLATLRAARLYPEPTSARVARGARRTLAEARSLGPVAGTAHLSRVGARFAGRALRRVARSSGPELLPGEVAIPDAGRATFESSPDALRVREMAESVNVAVRLSNGYHPQRLPVGLVCFEAPQLGPSGLSWSGVAAGGIVVHRAVGDHLDMVEHPEVTRTAGLVDEALADVV